MTPMKRKTARAAKTPRIIAGRGAMRPSAPELEERDAGGLPE
jgi:hypothetical protein